VETGQVAMLSEDKAEIIFLDSRMVRKYQKMEVHQIRIGGGVTSVASNRTHFAWCNANLVFMSLEGQNCGSVISEAARSGGTRNPTGLVVAPDLKATAVFGFGRSLYYQTDDGLLFGMSTLSGKALPGAPDKSAREAAFTAHPVPIEGGVKDMVGSLDWAIALLQPQSGDDAQAGGAGGGEGKGDDEPAQDTILQRAESLGEWNVGASVDGGLVDKLVEVVWPDSGQSYIGRVIEFKEDVGMHQVQYIDEDVKWHDLAKCSWRELSEADVSQEG
jgi:hypothetical protein